MKHVWSITGVALLLLFFLLCFKGFWDEVGECYKSAREVCTTSTLYECHIAQRSCARGPGGSSGAYVTVPLRT